jgi:hypothetical protein
MNEKPPMNRQEHEKPESPDRHSSEDHVSAPYHHHSGSGSHHHHHHRGYEAYLRHERRKARRKLLKKIKNIALILFSVASLLLIVTALIAPHLLLNLTTQEKDLGEASPPDRQTTVISN